MKYFVGHGLKIGVAIFVGAPTLINIRFPLMTNKFSNAYAFVDHFAYPTLKIMIGLHLPWLSKEIRQELQVNIED